MITNKEIKKLNTGTRPEKYIRRVLRNMEYTNYRLNKRDLPGKPDIVLPKYKTAIFVNGCFWHQHENCKYASLPKTKIDFWKNKLEGNKLRDKLKQSQLNELGWKIINVWECEIKDKKDHLCSKLKDISQ